MQVSVNEYLICFTKLKLDLFMIYGISNYKESVMSVHNHDIEVHFKCSRSLYRNFMYA